MNLDPLTPSAEAYRALSTIDALQRKGSLYKIDVTQDGQVVTKPWIYRKLLALGRALTPGLVDWDAKDQAHYQEMVKSVKVHYQTSVGASKDTKTTRNFLQVQEDLLIHQAWKRALTDPKDEDLIKASDKEVKQLIANSPDINDSSRWLQESSLLQMRRFELKDMINFLVDHDTFDGVAPHTANNFAKLLAYRNELSEMAEALNLENDPRFDRLQVDAVKACALKFKLEVENVKIQLQGKTGVDHLPEASSELRKHFGAVIDVADAEVINELLAEILEVGVSEVKAAYKKPILKEHAVQQLAQYSWDPDFLEVMNGDELALLSDREGMRERAVACRDLLDPTAQEHGKQLERVLGSYAKPLAIIEKIDQLDTISNENLELFISFVPDKHLISQLAKYTQIPKLQSLTNRMEELEGRLYMSKDAVASLAAKKWTPKSLSSLQPDEEQLLFSRRALLERASVCRHLDDPAAQEYGQQVDKILEEYERPLLLFEELSWLSEVRGDEQEEFAGFTSERIVINKLAEPLRCIEEVNHTFSGVPGLLQAVEVAQRLNEELRKPQSARFYEGLAIGDIQNINLIQDRRVELLRLKAEFTKLSGENPALAQKVLGISLKEIDDLLGLADHFVATDPPNDYTKAYQKRALKLHAKVSQPIGIVDLIKLRKEFKTLLALESPQMDKGAENEDHRVIAQIFQMIVHGESALLPEHSAVIGGSELAGCKLEASVERDFYEWFTIGDVVKPSSEIAGLILDVRDKKAKFDELPFDQVMTEERVKTVLDAMPDDEKLVGTVDGWKQETLKEREAEALIGAEKDENRAHFSIVNSDGEARYVRTLGEVKVGEENLGLVEAMVKIGGAEEAQAKKMQRVAYQNLLALVRIGEIPGQAINPLAPEVVLRNGSLPGSPSLEQTFFEYIISEDAKALEVRGVTSVFSVGSGLYENESVAPLSEGEFILLAQFDIAMKVDLEKDRTEYTIFSNPKLSHHCSEKAVKALISAFKNK